MSRKKCNDPECYNYDNSASIFCEKCLAELVKEMNCNDLYDIFISGLENINRAIEDGEAHGLLTPNNKKNLIKCRKKWFDILNQVMLDKGV